LKHEAERRKQVSEWHSSREWTKARAYAKTVLDPTCASCSKQLEGEDWTIDHIIAPNGDTPNHNIDNLQSMCRACNSRKKDRVLQRVTWKNPRFQ
jgi:5-methylcytosine-specific restriction endonuclease McrA